MGLNFGFAKIIMELLKSKTETTIFGLKKLSPSLPVTGIPLSKAKRESTTAQIFRS